MENSITVNGDTYDFIITDEPCSIFGQGQDCHRCEVPKFEHPEYCKFCSAFDILCIVPNYKYKKKHYFTRRNKSV